MENILIPALVFAGAFLVMIGYGVWESRDVQDKDDPVPAPTFANMATDRPYPPHLPPGCVWSESMQGWVRVYPNSRAASMTQEELDKIVASTRSDGPDSTP